MFVPERLYAYMLQVGCREPEALARLREETARLEQAHYQIAPEEGQLLGFLIEAIGARRALDIGTFTGYSALIAALSMPEDGQVVTLDTSEEFTAIARRHWQAAGVADRIDLRLAPALESLEVLLADGGAGQYDFAFIDADKERYDAYYELALRLLRPGGLAAVDNTLWRGRVVDPDNRKAKTEAFRAFNAKLHGDPRVTLVMLPVGDGVTLVRKRPQPGNQAAYS